MPLTPAEEAEKAQLERELGDGPMDLTSRLESIGGPVADFVTRAALPTLAGAAGVAMGSRLPGVGPAIRRAAIPALESGLSAGGEYLNQALDVTPENPMDVLLAGGLPAAARGAGAAGRGLIGSGWLPGSVGGLTELAAESSGQLVAKVRPTVDPDLAWEQAKSFAPVIPARNFKASITKLRQDEDLLRDVPSLQYAGMTKLLDELEGSLNPVSETIDLQTFDAIRKRLGEFSRSLKGPEQGAYRKAYGAILDDIEASAKMAWIGPSTQPAVDALKIAMSATRRDLAADALEESIAKAVFTRAGDHLTTFRANQVVNDLRKAKGMEAYRRAVAKGDISATEQAEILDTLKAVTKLGTAPPAAGAQFGSGRAVIGYFAGKAMLEAAGVPSGMAETIAMGGNAAAWILSRIMMSDSGRSFVKAVAQGGGHLNPQTLGVMANVIRAGTVSQNEVDPSELPPMPSEIQLPPVYDILPSEIDPNQLPRSR